MKTAPGDMCVALLLWAGCLFLTQPSTGVTGLELEGCYSGLDRSLAESFVLTQNTNADCAEHCAARGYILAATHRNECLCTLVYPTRLLGHPLFSNASGSGTPCNTPCGGSFEQSDCHEDECCGGTFQGSDAYSVYATGGIDVVSQVEARLMRALEERADSMTWFDASFTKECSSNFTERRVAGENHIKLQVNRADYTLHRHILSADNCKKLCTQDNTCMSITYFVYDHKCTLNRLSSHQALTLPSSSVSYVYDRVCSSNVRLANQSYLLMTQNYKLMMSKGMVRERTPLYNEDFELDLTNSNFWDTVRRSISLSNSEEMEFSTQSGFESSRSETQTKESSTTKTNSDTTENSNTDSSSDSKSFHLGTTASVSASGGFFGFQASVSASVTTGFNLESSKAFSHTSSQGSSRTTSHTSTDTNSVTDAKSNFFNNGYHKSLRNERTQTYEYTMTVPPLHRGMINFLVEEGPLLLKWRSTFRLDGHIKIVIHDLTRSIHVSRILTARERQFFTLGSISYNRRTIVGKTTIRDREGNIIERRDQLLERN